ncbi:MAG: gliding motility protein GldM [Flavobacteriales bacterium]|nr:gliding motility protein GldM [Flavobacteriales bacterium]
MAGEKASPRQKMIGMMYLVLTALLALNVSKDILESFVSMNDGLSLSLENFESKNEFIYNELEKEKSYDPTKVGPFWTKAQAIKGSSDEIYSFIDELKKELIAQTEKLPEAVADTATLQFVENLDNYDIPTQILIGSTNDGSGGRANELKNKIHDFKSKIFEIVGAEEAKLLSIGLETDDVNTAEGTRSWEVHNFYHAPLAATVAMLTKLQNDVRSAELDAVTHLYQAIDNGSIPFDTIAAKVIAPSNYVLMGEEYQADVFVAAFSRTQRPEVLLGSWDSEAQELRSFQDSLPVSEGIGKMSRRATKEGVHKWGGVIKLKTKAGYKNYPFESEYTVARPMAVVSPIKMNMLYRGVDNPLSISVPGVSSDKITATITGSGNALKKQKDGTYLAVVSTSSPRTVKVRVSANLESGSKPMGDMEFRVGNVPTPTAQFAGMSGFVKCPRVKAAPQLGLRVQFAQGFAYDLPAKVTSYKMSITRGGSIVFSETIKGNRFPSKVTKIMQNLRKGDRIDFENIQGKINNTINRKLDAISVKITS